MKMKDVKDKPYAKKVKGMEKLKLIPWLSSDVESSSPKIVRHLGLVPWFRARHLQLAPFSTLPSGS